MEIKNGIQHPARRATFKIDLIVWKFDMLELVSIVNNLFKIDLIVWKSFEFGPFTSNFIKFKIDLIVWKFQDMVNL